MSVGLSFWQPMPLATPIHIYMLLMSTNLKSAQIVTKAMIVAPSVFLELTFFFHIYCARSSSGKLNNLWILECQQHVTLHGFAQLYQLASSHYGDLHIYVIYTYIIAPRFYCLSFTLVYFISC